MTSSDPMRDASFSDEELARISQAALRWVDDADAPPDGFADDDYEEWSAVRDGADENLVTAGPLQSARMTFGHGAALTETRSGPVRPTSMRRVRFLDEVARQQHLLQSVQAEILRLIEELVDSRGMALMLISHDLPLVSRFCDRVAVMYAGQVMEELPAADLHRATHAYTRGLLECLPSLSHRRERLATLRRDPAWLAPRA